MRIATRRKANDDLQLDLFALTTARISIYETTDAIRLNGREALARIPSEDGRGTGSDTQAAHNASGGGGENGSRDGRASPPVDVPGNDGAAGPRPGLGNGAGEIHLAAARIELNGHNAGVDEQTSESSTDEPVQPRNQNNYRITDKDRIGTGSLKQKCRDNLAAIGLLKQLEAEARPATDDEKRVLVRYVGWGGLPQVFDSLNSQWEKEREQLESLLTEDELDSARASTLNAHYTAPVVIQSMYSALEHFGFSHGRILEPALGLGHFIGLMPGEMQKRSLITGVEIDSITARLARALYPDADIRHQPFEETRLADGFYDAAISNIPFGNYKPFDTRFKTWNFVIHDYFFAAALEKVRPGGLVLFITSHGTLDKVDGALWELISQKADLLGAIRLPNDAFKKNANTKVTTDIVMLRKRLPGQLPTGPAWKELAEITNSQGETIPVNEYFAARPELMLGEMCLEGKMYSDGEPTLVSNGRPLNEQLAEAIALLPKHVFKPEVRHPDQPNLEQSFPAPEHIKPNAYALVNQQLAVRDGDTLRMLTGLSSQVAKRIRGLIRVRDAVRCCLRSQLNGTLDANVVLAREQLNQAYDSFVSRLGPISDRANTSAYRGDPDLPLLLSLENYDEETKRATKAAIFRERTIQKQRHIVNVSTPQEALLVTLNERGCVDLEHLGSLLHRRPSEFLPDLKGTVFLNPQTNRWETEDDYLSGNVRAKLAVAEAASLTDEQFKVNIEALKAVQPADLSATQIDARLGSTWIPAGDVRLFAEEVLGEPGISPSSGAWLTLAAKPPLTFVSMIRIYQTIRPARSTGLCRRLSASGATQPKIVRLNWSSATCPFPPAGNPLASMKICAPSWPHEESRPTKSRSFRTMMATLQNWLCSVTCVPAESESSLAAHRKWAPAPMSKKD
jgi:hypothetical protein